MNLKGKQMKALNYARLLNIANTVPSYRGNVNRFPIGNRKQNNKYFLRRDEDGYTVFDIVYGETWNSTEIDRAEYIRLKLENRKFRKETGTQRAHTYVTKFHQWGEVDGKWVHLKKCEYYRRDKGHNIMGTVRPDNSFEFTKSRYYQGDRCFLTQHSAGWFTTDSRRGGVVYSEGRGLGEVFHPIWKGMRVNCETMQAITPYMVVTNHINRKASKGILSKYEHMFKVSEVMLKAMNLDTINSTCVEIVEGIYGEGAHKKHEYNNNDLIAKAEEFIDDAPLDAFLLFTLGYDVKRVGYRMRYGSSHYYAMNDDTPENIFISTKRRIAKEIYKQSPEILKPVSYQGGKRYPACEWGVKVVVNDQPMEQSI
jgi:hypothetical protein